MKTKRHDDFIKSLLFRSYLILLILDSVIAIYDSSFVKQNSDEVFSLTSIMSGFTFIVVISISIVFLIISIKRAYPVLIILLPLVEAILILNLFIPKTITFWYFARILQMLLALFYLIFLLFKKEVKS